jgi:predicted O-methyltransferase YrrM
MLVKQSDEVTPWFRRSKLDGRNPLGDDGPGVAARAALRRGQAQQVFADEPRVQIRCGDWRELAQQAPFDLLVLDGGGQGKGDEPPLEPAEWLRPGGVVVLDDFTPGAGLATTRRREPG